MFHLSSGFFKCALKNKKKQKIPTASLQITNFSNSTIVLQVDEVKYYNQNETLLVLLNDGKYILVVNLEFSNDQFSNTKFRIQSKHTYLTAGSIIILHSYTFRIIKLVGRESAFDLLSVLDYTLIGENKDLNSCSNYFETDNVTSLKKIKSTNCVDSTFNFDIIGKNQSKKEIFLIKVCEFESKKQENFTKLNEIFRKKDGEIITTIGIITFIDELKEITPRNKSQIKIRNFYITDYSINKVKVAIWGKQAEEFVYKLDDILIINNIKITHFNCEIVLSVQRVTNIEIC
jgi:hypothetical protein